MGWDLQGGISHYLSEVLGLKWIIKRTQKEIKPRLASLTIAVPRAPNPAEKVMIQKMLSAIGVKDYLLVVGLPKVYEIALAFGIDAPGLIETSQTGEKILHSLDLNLLIEGQSESIALAKRQAWEHLKQVKFWLEEPLK